MKVPNKVLHAVRNLALIHQGKVLEAQVVSPEDSAAVLIWALAGIAKRADATRATKEDV